MMFRQFRKLLLLKHLKVQTLFNTKIEFNNTPLAAIWFKLQVEPNNIFKPSNPLSYLSLKE